MIKKVLIAGLFLGGGYFFIKKLLPKLNKDSKALKVDKVDYKVKRFISNPTGGGGSITERNVRNTQPFAVLMKAGQGNDSSWGFDPYNREEQGDFIKGANNMVL